MIIFLYGRNTYLVQEKYIYYKNIFTKKYPQGILEEYDTEEKIITENVLETILVNNTLFETKKCIIVKNLLTSHTAKQKKIIRDILYKNEKLQKDTDTVLIFFEKEYPKKNCALYKSLKTISREEEFSELSFNAKKKWIREKIIILNSTVTLTEDVLTLITSHTSNNLYAAENEIKKLLQLTEKNEITKEIIDTIMVEKTGDNIFKTIEALTENNTKNALTLFENHMKNGDDPFYIFLLYISHIRNLLKIKSALNQTSDVQKIKELTGIHPFVIKKNMLPLRKISLIRLKEMLQSLEKIDTDSKNGNNYLRIALETFLILQTQK